MSERPAVYIVVADDAEGPRWFARFTLKGALQLMGCKPLHSDEIADLVFTQAAGRMACDQTTDDPCIVHIDKTDFLEIVRERCFQNSFAGTALRGSSSFGGVIGRELLKCVFF